MRSKQEPSPETSCCCVDGRDQGTGLQDGGLAEPGRGGAGQAETTVTVFLSVLSSSALVEQRMEAAQVSEEWGVGRTAGSEEHCQECRTLQGMGSTT